MIQILKRDKPWAEGVWSQVTYETGAFGPDFSGRVPGEQHWEILVNDQSVGMGWCRRFTPNGSVLNRGHALFANCRRRGLSSREILDSLDTAILEANPACRTLICVVWDTNPTVLAMARARRKELGAIPDGDHAMHFFLVRTQ